MTNTYKAGADIFTKFYEELRCLRCVMERLLKSFDGEGFKDYESEKFSGHPEERQHIRKQSMMENVKVIAEGLESAIVLEKKLH